MNLPEMPATFAAALDSQTQATLALAYEQRTANLITAISLPGLGNAVAAAEWRAVRDNIVSRLGLDGGGRK